jgi:hypothetical protein
MELQHNTISAYHHAGVEALITSLNTELLEDFAPVEAKHDAQQEKPLTETAFKIRVIDFVKGKVQHSIHEIFNLVLPAAAVHNAKEAEELAQKHCQEKRMQINERQQQLGPLKRKLKLVTPDEFKQKYAPVVLIAACIVGLADAAIAYSSFRMGSYSVLMAAAAALAIAASISVSHFFYSPWILKAPTPTKKKIRIAIVLSIAFLFFAFASNLRSDAAAQVINIDSLAGDTLVYSAPVFSKWTVCIISFVLFLVVFFMSLVTWRSTEDCAKAAEHKKIRNQIDQLSHEIKALEAEIVSLNSKVQAEKKQARDCYDYTCKAIARVKHIGEQAITIYKMTYCKYRGEVPDFFEDSPVMVYEESFSLVHPQTALL